MDHPDSTDEKVRHLIDDAISYLVGDDFVSAETCANAAVEMLKESTSMPYTDLLGHLVRLAKEFGHVGLFRASSQWDSLALSVFDQLEEADSEMAIETRERFAMAFYHCDTDSEGAILQLARNQAIFEKRDDLDGLRATFDKIAIVYRAFGKDAEADRADSDWLEALRRSTVRLANEIAEVDGKDEMKMGTLRNRCKSMLAFIQKSNHLLQQDLTFAEASQRLHDCAFGDPAAFKRRHTTKDRFRVSKSWKVNNHPRVDDERSQARSSTFANSPNTPRRVGTLSPDLAGGSRPTAARFSPRARTPTSTYGRGLVRKISAASELDEASLASRSCQSSPPLEGEDEFQDLDDTWIVESSGLDSPRLSTSSLFPTPSRSTTHENPSQSLLSDSQLLGHFGAESQARKADAWFQDLQESIELVRGRDGFYRSFSHHNSSNLSYRPVKIAVIDTGLSTRPTARPPPLAQLYRQQIKEFHCFLEGPKGAWKDIDGHGTHCAMLVLQVCPNAQLYIARVVEKTGDALDPVKVSDAIRHAVDQWNVDIISLSMGWGDDKQPVVDALNYAQSRKKLVFAATANSGARSTSGIMFPARRSNVISIDAADGDGDFATGNPPNDRLVLRLAAPGDSVLSAFPYHLDSTGSRRMSGASVATPIAAGLVGLILEFARQPPLRYQPKVAEKLMDVDVLKHLLAQKFSQPGTGGGGSFRFLTPRMTFHDRKGESGGDAHDTASARYKAAEGIIQSLEYRSNEIRSLSVEELIAYRMLQPPYPPG